MAEDLINQEERNFSNNTRKSKASLDNISVNSRFRLSEKTIISKNSKSRRRPAPKDKIFSHVEVKENLERISSASHTSREG